MCGILGLILAEAGQSSSAAPAASNTAAAELLAALLYLQHRGQDAAGITTLDSPSDGLAGNTPRFHQCKGSGMALNVFTPARLSSLVGPMGIAHLRYPTAGSSSQSEAQPFYTGYPFGIALSHNGNLTNGEELKTYLIAKHRHVNTESDSELLLNVLASKLPVDTSHLASEGVFSAIASTMDLISGAYAVTGLIAGFGLFAFRDPNGIRPLLIGKRPSPFGYDYMLASESVVLTAHGFDYRDILPGQAVVIPQASGIPQLRQVVECRSYTPDIFEYVYFARPDSVQDGISVYHSRLAMGRALAKAVVDRFPGKDITSCIDVVIPVPDTARTCALELAVTLGIPYREGFVKNRYIGRTFIMPAGERQSSVRRKLNAMTSEFAGRNVLIVDDSIVRGTTSREIVSMARDAGAAQVYVASAAPAIRFNHVYGIDLADTRDLVAFGRSSEEVCTAIGADEVIFQELGDLVEAVKSCVHGAGAGLVDGAEVADFEVGVFTGGYVTGDVTEYLEETEARRARHKPAGKPAGKRGGGSIASTAGGIVDATKEEFDIGIYNSGDY